MGYHKVLCGTNNIYLFMLYNYNLLHFMPPNTSIAFADDTSLMNSGEHIDILSVNSIEANQLKIICSNTDTENHIFSHVFITT